MVEQTSPLTRLAWGVVNTSSDGIFGLQTIPFCASDAPPIHSWSSARPTVKDVPGPEYFKEWIFLVFNQSVLSLKFLLCLSHSATGSSLLTLDAWNIASPNFLIASLSSRSGKTLFAHAFPGHEIIFQLILNSVALTKIQKHH